MRWLVGYQILPIHATEVFKYIFTSQHIENVEETEIKKNNNNNNLNEYNFLLSPDILEKNWSLNKKP